MLKIIKMRIFCVSFFLVLSTLLRAQDPTCLTANGQKTGCSNVIFTAVPYLRIAPDARSAGMGDIGISTSPDANSIYFNASKLAFTDKSLEVSATYTPWLRALQVNDVYIANLGAYKKLGEYQTVGLSLRYFSLGTIPFTDSDGNALNPGYPNEFDIAASYSRKLSKGFGVGITGKFIYSDLASGLIVEGQEISAGKAFAADLSATWKLPIKVQDKKTELTMGLVLSNIGSKVSYTKSQYKDYLPANFGLGGVWKYDFDKFNTVSIGLELNKLMVPSPQVLLPKDSLKWDANSNKIPDYKEKAPIASIISSFGDAPGGGSEELKEIMWSLGLEYVYDQQFALRAGYFYEHPSKGGRKYITLGVGVKYNVLGLNFSYLIPTTATPSPLNNTLRFTLSYTPARASDEEPPVN